MMPTLQLRRTSLFWFQGAWELGRVFGGELFCLFVTAVVCLFVCLFFPTPKVGHYFAFLSLTSGWGFLVFFLFFVFFFVLFCFSFKMLNSPTIIWGQVDFFFVSPVDKVFCFLLFLFIRLSLFYSVLFCFVFVVFASKNSIPLDIKWCALILILLHRWWWWTLRHRQFWITVQFSEKSNSNLKLY